MSAESPVPDLAECSRFVRFWMEATGAPHVTLVAIIPDGQTAARTFAGADADMTEWVAERQHAGCNVYWQPNETRPGCDRKPGKADIPAALCRFADIDPRDDPADGGFPLAEERERLGRLAEHLIADADLAPTVVIDSGAGLQPVWTTAREALTPEGIGRIEAETRAIEAALGAGGTHNIDRLLRLPGTVNRPNRRKMRLNRPVARARLIHAAPNLYTPAQAAALATRIALRLDGTGLVRPKPAKPTAEGAPDAGEGDKEVEALVKELRAANGHRTSSPDHLPDALRARLDAVLKSRHRFADRWKGLADDLTRDGKDASGSGLDMSIAAMAKMSGFSRVEAGLIVCAFPHGKANGGDWPKGGRLRHVARCVLRSRGQDPIEALIAEFNDRYAVVNEGGKALVYEPAHDPVLKRDFYTRITFEDFKKLYLNRRVMVGEDTVRAADLWLASPGRRQFLGGVVFDPSGKHVRDNALNLWQGFAVRPRSGSWQRLRHHLLTVLCAGNQAYFDYLMGWMARLAQRPAEQGEVAVVMRGGEGTGKGTLARALLRLFGQHGLTISNSKHLTGNFNGHLRDCVFLFADEAFFAGDRAHVGVLKALITEPYLTIEAKYQNASQMPNFTHLMMASNEEWVVPASLDARRFFVLEVSEGRKNDHAYFGAIWQEMEHGGYEAMLHDLLDYDLTFFNVRQVPQTEGLQQQRKLSLGTSEAWWLDVLHRGYVFRSRLGLEDYFGEWHDEVSTEILFASYEAYARERHERHPMSRETFGRFVVTTIAGKPKRLANAVVGEHITDVSNPYGGTTRKAQTIKHPRPHGFTLGALGLARAAFHGVTGIAGAWAAEESQGTRT